MRIMIQQNFSLELGLVTTMARLMELMVEAVTDFMMIWLSVMTVMMKRIKKRILWLFNSNYYVFYM